MTEPRRVLHVVKGLGPGGAERLLVSLAGASDPSLVRHQVAYVLPWKDHLVAKLSDLNVPCHLLGGRRGLADPRWLSRLAHLVDRTSPDIVHIHSPALAAGTRLVVRARRRRPGLVTTEHNTWDSYAPLTRWANRLTAPLDDRRVAVSEEVLVSMPRRVGVRTEVVVHGIPVAALSARRGERADSRAVLGAGPDEVVVVVVANLRANKDYPTLLAAARMAIDQAPQLRFVSIGQGPLGAELRAQASGLGLGPRFAFLGYHSDPAAVLAGCDLFTLSSRYEGLSIALLEAFALGLPAVVTDVGANAKVLRDGTEGLVVPSADPDSLAQAYVALAGASGRRRAMGEAAARRATDFDIAHAVGRLAAIYQGCGAEP